MVSACHFRIIQVIVGLDTGGAELMLKRLAESHRGDFRFRHIIVSLTTVGTVGPQLQALGFEVHALGMRSVLDAPRTVWRLVSLIRSVRPDIVQTWMYYADLLGGVAARIAGNRNVVWGVRTTHVTAGSTHAIAVARKLCAWLSSFVPRVIVCAAEASRQAHIAIGYNRAKFEIIPNGFDLNRLVATGEQRAVLRTQCGWSEGVVCAGYLGRFHPDKDPENFVRSAGLVARRFKEVRFLLVGRDLDGRNTQLLEWINATGYPERFTLLGERSDVPACLAAMDVFCLASRTEGFPNVVGEAMAMGLPCVVTDVGDAAMLVTETGVVVPKEDAEALAAGLEQLFEMTPEARRSLGRRAKTRIQSEFSMDRARERYESIYLRLTKEKVI